MRPRRLVLMAVAVLAALAAAAIAAADNIQIQGVDSSGVAIVAPGDSVVIEWRIHETGSDGCSADRRHTGRRHHQPLGPGHPLRLHA